MLTLMQDHSSDVLEYLPSLIRDFPGLAKRMYHFCAKVLDKNEVASVILSYLNGGTQITEYQLFWLGMMVEGYLPQDSKSSVAIIIMSIYEHQDATDITRAKILEIPEKRFGLPDLRNERLRSGHSHSPAWAAAVGSRNQPKSQRNHLLKYFRKSSKPALSKCSLPPFKKELPEKTEYSSSPGARLQSNRFVRTAASTLTASGEKSRSRQSGTACSE